ncbi:MAG: hypothetical protein IJ225_10385 [Solobacterium sp.]|nr:hypothetical protein [Solobacterium sp.]
MNRRIYDERTFNRLMRELETRIRNGEDISITFYNLIDAWLRDEYSHGWVNGYEACSEAVDRELEKRCKHAKKKA